MSIFDSLKALFGQGDAGAVPALLSEGLASTNLGDLQGLVNRLQEGGLGTQVQSWLGDGQNLPITPDLLKGFSLTSMCSSSLSILESNRMLCLTCWPNIFRPRWTRRANREPCRVDHSRRHVHRAAQEGLWNQGHVLSRSGSKEHRRLCCIGEADEPL